MTILSLILKLELVSRLKEDGAVCIRVGKPQSHVVTRVFILDVMPFSAKRGQGLWHSLE